MHNEETEAKSIFIKLKRKRMGLTQKDFAELLSLGESGERTVRGWENDEHTPSKKAWERILELNENAPFKNLNQDIQFKFIDLFAGIGGIRLPFQESGGYCAYTSEWDKFAKKTYAANFGEVPAGDITRIDASTIPDHDILLAGFPCQAFSQAGLKKGFMDTRGTMFFEIQRILAEKKPKAFLLENVKQMKGHEKGRTLETIIAILKGSLSGIQIPSDVPMSEAARKALSTKLNYWVDWKILRAADYGVPQNRERLIIVGFRRDGYESFDFNKSFNWPASPENSKTVGDILEDSGSLDAKYTISQKLWDGHQRRLLEHRAKGNGFGYSLFDSDSKYTNTLSARYYKDGSEILIDQKDLGKLPRKLTPRECARLQGFPENFIVNAVSDNQAYRQFGNSVAVPVIRAVCKQMLKTMRIAGMVDLNDSSKPRRDRLEPAPDMAALR